MLKNQSLFSVRIDNCKYTYIVVAAMTSFWVDMDPFYIFSSEKHIYWILSLQFE